MDRLSYTTALKIGILAQEFVNPELEAHLYPISSAIFLHMAIEGYDWRSAWDVIKWVKESDPIEDNDAIVILALDDLVTIGRLESDMVDGRIMWRLKRNG